MTSLESRRAAGFFPGGRQSVRRLGAFVRRLALRASVRRHRRAQEGSPMLRSIRPTRATTSLAASVDPTDARNGQLNLRGQRGS